MSATSAMHQSLAELNTRRLLPALPTPDWSTQIARDAQLMLVEGLWLEEERQRHAIRAHQAPSDPDRFVHWIENLQDSGPGQNDLLFDYLATQATMDEMRWFIAQEISGEAGFEDLLALAQVRFPMHAKLEMARNYWDEMGRGTTKGMHGPMLQVLSRTLNVTPLIDRNVWEATALNNLMVGLSSNRRYAYHALGALGAIELTAPPRAHLVSKGLKRLGIKAEARHYFDLHAVLDVKHSDAWNREVFHSVVENYPASATAIAEGALMRLYCGQRCFERYRAEFGL